MKSKIFQSFAIIMILLGYSLITLPYVADQYARIGQTASISSYDNQIKEKDENELNQIMNNCRVYNDKIAQQHEKEYFHYDDTQDYSNDYLAFPFENSDIGSVLIPKIDVNLPIGHGTSEEVLQAKVGHIYGTSLPCGGVNTHAVISGHSGLRTAQMFDDLAGLKIGDKVYVKISNQILEYTVSEINVVLPEEHDQYMQVEKGKDLLTLYTCTPYGINSHRLLVKCEHTNTSTIEETQQSQTVNVKVDTKKPLIMIVMVYGLPAMLAIGAIIYTVKKED